MKETKLNATTQKSYYGKAKVIENENGITELKSYDTIVCKVVNGEFIRLWSGYSQTTLNHINDFRKLFDMNTLNKKSWLSLPCENGEKWQIEYNNGFIQGRYSTIYGSYEEAEKQIDKLYELNTRCSYTAIEV